MTPTDYSIVWWDRAVSSRYFHRADAVDGNRPVTVCSRQPFRQTSRYETAGPEERQQIAFSGRQPCPRCFREEAGDGE